MLYLVLILVLVVAIAAVSLRRVRPDEQLLVLRRGEVIRTHGPGIAFVVPLLQHTRRVDTAPHRRWAVVTERTADGANAHVRVQFVARVVDAAVAPTELGGAVVTAVQHRLREDVMTSSVNNLPMVGETMPWEPEEFVAGAAVEQAKVTVCDVEASNELRRA